MKIELQIKSLEEIDAVAAQFLEKIGDKRVFAFYGEMGMGKTTFIAALCRVLGADDTVSSPTFAIVNEYACANSSIYHFDFYRIKTEEEAYDFDCDDYFYSGCYCFVEWPEKIPNLLPEDHVRVEITEINQGARKIEIEL